MTSPFATSISNTQHESQTQNLTETQPSGPNRNAVPEGSEVRGFALYVGLDEVTAAASDHSLGEIVSQIKALVAQLAPAADTYATVALAPSGRGGRGIDVVRLALGEPGAHARQKAKEAEDSAQDRTSSGVVIDLSRKRLLLDSVTAPLTYKEFELLQYFVLREGRTVERQELIDSLWADAPEEETPNSRTIDVHIRRLRVKLENYQEIIRTVRGVGYRFDRHADVRILHTATPSPDVF